jgi:hypothetical protein
VVAVCTCVHETISHRRQDRIAPSRKSTSLLTERWRCPLFAVFAASEPGNECTCRMRRARRRIRRHVRCCYLALPVVLDGMIMSATCRSLGSMSRTSLFASLVYS